MMISGSAGITRNTLDSADRPSSADAAEVAGGDADQDATSAVATMPATKPTNMHAAGADEDLAEDVLAEVRGAEPVLAGRRLDRSLAARAPGRTARSTAR